MVHHAKNRPTTNLRKRKGIKNKKHDYFGRKTFQNNRT